MLHVGAAQSRADFVKQKLTFCVFGAVKSYLDQFVGFEAAVDFRQYRGGEPFLADGDDGIQMVRGGPQGAALGGVNFSHGGIVA